MTTEAAAGRRTMALVLAGLLLAAIAWFAWLDSWWLNSDGSAYLSVGSNFLRTHHLALPDGAGLAWTDRPVYPLLLVAPWVIRQSLEASIWMSRLPLIVAPLIVAVATFRFSRSVIAAGLAGLAAIAQPWTLIAGGSNLVPDGLTAMALLVAVVCASLAVASRSARFWWLAAGLFAVAVAAETKETGLLGLMLVGVVLWVGFVRPRRWLVLTGLAAVVVLTVALLIIVNGPTNLRLLDLPREFGDQLTGQVLGDSPLVVVVSVIALALIGWSLPRCTEPLPLAGLVLIAQGVALGLYASGSGLGQRNAACLPYGLCLLLGAFLGDALPRTAPRYRWGAVALALVTIAALLAVSVPRAVSASEASARSWDSPSTRGAASWLDSHARHDRIGCSLLFCSFYWFSEDGELDLRLLPQYGARLGPTSLDQLDFNERSGWRGPVSGSPACKGAPLVVTKSDERFGAIFECSLLQFVRCSRLRYVVVGGWNLNDTYDAGRLIPYLEANPAFERVYASPPEDWPRVLAIYKVVAPLRSLPDPPLLMSEPAYRALTANRSATRAKPLEGESYRQTIQALLARPPGSAHRVQNAGTDEGAPIPTRCPTNLDRVDE